MSASRPHDGKPRDPDYWKKWRAAHQAYREREKRRSRDRTTKSHGDRAGQYQRRRERLRVRRAEHGWVESNHPILDDATLATQNHIRPDRRTHYLDPLYEDCLMSAVLAILEGSDPHEAIKSTLHAERGHRARSLPLDDAEPHLAA